MRKPLVLAILAVLAAGLVWVVFLDPPASAPPPTPVDRTAPPTATEAAAAAEPADRRRVARPTAAAADGRPIKVGAGRHGLHGIVVDEGGEPVPGAWVAAWSVPFPLLDFEFDLAEIFEKPLAFSLEPLAATIADEQGRFALEGVQGRTLYLSARAEKRLTPRRQRVLPAELDGGGEVVLRTVAGAALKGRVVDADGSPVAGAEVLVGPGVKYLIAAFRNRNFFLERTFTGPDGSFAVAAVPARTALMANGIAQAVDSGLADVGPLPPGATAEVVVSLGATGALAGEVVDLEGEPVAGAEVIAVPLDLRYVIPFVRDVRAWTTTSDGQGRYRFPRLPKALVLLLAQGRQGRSAPETARVIGPDSLAPRLRIDTKSLIEGRVVDGDGRPIAGAVVRLQSIPVSVGAEKGKTRTGAGFLLDAARELLPELLPQAASATTDAGGRFRIPAWSQARLRVEAAGYSEADFHLSQLDEGKKPVLRIWRPGTIEGRVIEEASGRPVRFCLVRGDLWFEPGEEGEGLLEMIDEEAPAGGPPEAAQGPDWLGADEQILDQSSSWRAKLRGTVLVDDDRGAFRIAGIPPGQWHLTVQAEGYQNAERQVQVPDGGVVEGIEIALRTGAVVSGRVTAASTGRPVAGAVVTVGHGEESGFLAMLQGLGDSVAMAETGEDGSFRVTGAEAGADFVNAVADGWASASQRIPALAEQEVRTGVEIVLHDGGALSGFVRDRRGNPLPGRMVGALSIQARDFQQTATDEAGHYRMEHMRPGAYFMMAADLEDESLFAGDMMSMLGSSRITTAYVKDGEETVMDIVDPAAGGCRLGGRLLDGDEPIPGASLVVLSSEGGGLMDFNLGFATARTDQNGEFLFKSLAPGEYRLQVDSPSWNGALPLEVWEVPEDYQEIRIPVGVVRGRVVSGRDGSPVAGASIQLVSDDPLGGGLAVLFGGGAERKWAVAEEDGSFEIRGLRPGRYHLEVQGGRGRRRSGDAGPPLGRVEGEPFRLLEGEVRDVGPIQLPVAGAIRVVTEIAGADAGESSWFTARAVRPGEEDEQDGPFGFGRGHRSWGKGELLISGLEAGTWTVIVGGDGFLETRIPEVEVRAGETAEVFATLQRGVPLRIRILDARNNPVTPADVALLDPAGKRLNPKRGGIGAMFGRMFGEPEIDLGTHPTGSYRIRFQHQGATIERGLLLTEDSGVIEIRI
ncbi:MAG: carboxypeptidase regulatory-like domain-containing protein [Planctomycetota bacterium]|nr:MAG: carboxypeptidase regulatory-like domain-containing protein [Planctomycetota bacterium]